MSSAKVRIRSGKKPRLRLLDLELKTDDDVNEKENVRGQPKRPYGGIKGNYYIRQLLVISVI